MKVLNFDQNQNKTSIRRVGIIGAGAVGSATAFAMMQAGVPRELILQDINHGVAEGQIMDLQHCLPYGRPIKLAAGDLDDIASCDLVVVTAGAAQQPGESRLNLLKRNADILGQFFPRLPKANPNAIFLIITNPVDVMTRLVRHLCPDVDARRIIGTGTVLDSARFRTLLSEEFHIDPRNIHAYVIGEHGDSEVLVWSRVDVGPFPLEEFAQRRGIIIDEDFRTRIDRNVRGAAYQIIERKGATNFAIGISTLRIFESIRNNQHSIQTVSRSLNGAYGYNDICLSLPCILDSNGAQAPIEMSLSEQELSAFHRSAEKLDAAYRQIIST